MKMIRCMFVLLLALAMLLPLAGCGTGNFEQGTEEVITEEAAAELQRLLDAFLEEAGGDLNPVGCLWPEQYPSDYAGAYFNTDGELVVMITEGFESSARRFRTLTGNPHLLTRTAPHSYRELEELARTCNRWRAACGSFRFEVLGVKVDACNNCVFVQLRNTSNAAIQDFRKLVSDSDAIILYS